MDTSPNMDKLPIEIISHIIQYLGWSDKESASLVCKKWYKASIDPSINRNVIFKLRCDGRVKPPAKDLEGIGHRKIRNLLIYTTSDEVYNEVRNWSGYKSITDHITTIKMREFTSTSAEVFLDIVNNCPNIQTVNMYVHKLFSFLRKDTIRDKMLGVLTNLSKLILNLGSSANGPEEIEYLMILPQVVMHLEINTADLSEKSSTQGLAISILRGNLIPISTLRLFSEKYNCPLSIGWLNSDKNKIRLAHFLGVLRRFPRLKVRVLNVTLYSISEVNDVNQLSDINVNSFNLRLGFNTDEWFTRNSLSSLVSASPFLNRLSFPLSVKEGTFDCILQGLPYVHSVLVDQSPFLEYEEEPGPIPEHKRYRDVQVMFRTASDGKPKWLMIRDTNIQKVLIARTSLTFSEVHPNLKEFSLTGIFTFQDHDFVLKLITCFPGLTTICLAFEKTGAEYITERDWPNQIDLSLFSRLKKLQVLWLSTNSYLAKIKMNGVQFPELKELDLSGCVNLTNECLQDIGRSMPSLEKLNISHCLRIGDVGLQAVLKSLTHLRELRVIGCEQVNSTTLKMISNCSSSLKLLWVSKGNDEFTAAIEEILESRSNLTIEYERIREMKF